LSNLATLKPTWTNLGPLLVHARVAGPPDAPPLVLLHGLGVSGTYMVPLAQQLAGRWRVLVPDLPGFGASDAPRRALSVRGLASALRAWLDAEELPRVTLVANSLGCQVAIDVAARDPDRFERLVLMGPTVDPRYRSFGRHTPRFFVDALREPASLVGIIAVDYARFGPLRFAATARSALDDRPEDKVGRIDAPTLVVKGGRDGFVSAAWCERLASGLARGELVVVPGEPHAVHYTAPGRVAALVQEHADRVA
jgi:pimeloyl-ACP methyl ester carboxylesterase